MSLNIKEKTSQYLSQAMFPIEAGKAKFWCLSPNELTQMADYIYDPEKATLMTNLVKLFNADPQKALISVRAYPLSLTHGEVTSQSGPMTFVREPVTNSLSTYILDTEKIGNVHQIASFDIEYFAGIKSYLSYAPYTKLQLYLPFVGMYDLDPTLYMNKRVTVNVIVDFFSGDATFYICRCTLGTYNNEEVMDTLTTHIAIDVDVYGNNIRDTYKSFLKTLTTIFTSPLSFGGVGNELLGKTKSTEISHGMIQNGALQSMAGFHMPMTVHLIRYDPVVKYYPQDTNYAHIVGIPCEKVSFLRTFSGYTVIEEVHTNSVVGATDPEINEIENLLKKGVRV